MFKEKQHVSGRSGETSGLGRSRLTHAVTPQELSVVSKGLCSACKDKLEAALHDLGFLPDEEPGWVYKAPEAAVLTKETADEVGLALHRLIHDRKWPRRSIINRLHHDFDQMIDRGLIPREADGRTLDFHDNYLDEVVPTDPECGWITSFANAAKRGYKRAPNADMYERLARLQMVLRALGHF